jgi:DNA modification methylase
VTRLKSTIREMQKDHVYNKSCEKMDDLGNDTIDLVVSSPPYFNLRDYAIWPDYQAHLGFIRNVLAECFRVLKPGAWICWNIQECLPISKDEHSDDERKGCRPLLADTIKILQEVGFYYEKDIIWYKGKGTATQKLFGSYPQPSLILVSGLTEHIITCRKPKGKYRREISDDIKAKSKISKDEWGKWAVDLWEIPPTKVKGHTAPYPIELVNRCIRLNSFYGDTVLDPFMGSGTTAIAAQRAGRHYIGYEYQKEYCDLIASRLKKNHDIFEGAE